MREQAQVEWASEPDPWSGARTWIARIALWLVPPQLRGDGHAYLRARILVGVSVLFLAILGVTFLAGEPMVPPTVQPIANRVIGSMAVGLFLVLAALRVTASLRVAANLLALVLLGNLVWACTLQGGFHSPSLPIYTTVPVVAGLLGGRAAGAGWALAVIGCWLGLLTFDQLGYDFPNPVPVEHRAAPAVFSLVLACVTTVSVVLVYESLNARLRAELAHDRAHFEFQAGHDLLTQLPNRRGFEGDLERALRRASRAKERIALVVVDLDDFKPVNDRFGHPAGDLVLKEVARRLCSDTRLTDCVARLGGDEFVLILEQVPDRESIQVVLDKIEQGFAEPIDVGAARIRVSASMGAALYPDDSELGVDLLEMADAAMYRNKHARR